MMKRYILAFSFAFLVLCPIYAALPSSQSSAADEHKQWIATILKEMQTIKIGMKRSDLLKVFKEEGGLSTRLLRRYAYRDCPYIKVNVEFKPVGGADNLRENYQDDPQDIIVDIRSPFLSVQ